MAESSRQHLGGSLSLRAQPVANGRRPSPYRDESLMASSGGGLAPPPGADAHFDARVAALQQRKVYLRETLWRQLGGEGEPAPPGTVQAYDVAFDRAWQQLQVEESRARRETAESQALSAEEAASSLSANAPMMPEPQSARASRTPFDADVAAEMAKLEAELRAELRNTSPPKQPVVPTPQPADVASVQQKWQQYQQQQQGQQPPFGQSATQNSPLQSQRAPQYQQPPRQQQQQQYGQPPFQQPMMGSQTFGGAPWQQPPPQQQQHPHSQMGPPLSSRHPNVPPSWGAAANKPSFLGGSERPLPENPSYGQGGQPAPFPQQSAPATGRRGHFSNRGASSISFS